MLLRSFIISRRDYGESQRSPLIKWHQECRFDHSNNVSFNNPGVNDPKIKCFADLTELEGWELRAAWDDFKIGLKHGSEFEKVAIVGNKCWEEFSAKVGSWVMSAKIEYFEDADSGLT